MLKLKEIKAFSDSMPRLRVSTSARRWAKTDTLFFNTQAGGPPVPCRAVLFNRF